MSEDKTLNQALEAVARGEVPETTNLWPRIAARIERKDNEAMNPQWKMIWTVALALLALILTTTAVYAVYHYFNDPGMQAVSEAGMVTSLDVTAVPATPPAPTPPAPATKAGEAQTVQGVTVTLDWMYLDRAWQSIGFSVAGLGEGFRLGMPALSFAGLTPEQYGGAGLNLAQTESGLKGRYVVYQVLRDPTGDSMQEIPVDATIAIPLLDASGQAVDTFRFAPQQVILHHLPIIGVNTYATRASGIDLSLDWLQMTPTETRLRLCSTAAVQMESAGVQWGREALQLFDAPVEKSQSVTAASDGERRCFDATFAPAAPDATMLRVLVSGLKDAGGIAQAGEWEIVWAELPRQKAVPGVDDTPSTAPVDTAPKVSMLEAYADAARIAVVLRIENMQDGQLPRLMLKDAQGKRFNAGYGISPVGPERPDVYTVSLNPEDMSNGPGGIFSKVNPLAGDRFTGQLEVNFETIMGTPEHTFVFDLDLPIYPAQTLQPQQTITANGLEMLLDTVKITPSYTQMYLCYQKPDANDWQFDPETTRIRIGDQEASIESADMLFNPEVQFKSFEAGWSAPAGSGPCMKLGFPLGHQNKAKTLTLTVQALEQNLPEAVPNDQLQLARQKLREEQGIDMDWVQSTGSNGGGGARMVINQKPDGMSESEVMRRFKQALGVYSPGPWVFTVDLEP